MASRLAPLLGLPLFYCLLILLADPYDVFHLPVNISSDTLRKKYAAPMNPGLFRFNRYQNDPKPDVVLGDSRMDLFRPETIKQQTGQDIANLSIPGGTMESTIDAYWLASEKTKLRTVTIGVSFDAYNDFRIGSEIPAVRTIQQNPMLYFTNRNVIDASLEAYRERLGSRVSNQFQLSGMSSSQIWQKGLEVYSTSIRNWRHPVRYKARLQEIADHCKANGTRLQFVILPQHPDANGMIRQFGLSKEDEAMRVELAKMASLVDLSNPSDLAREIEYADLLHFGQESTPPLIAKIWPTNR